MPNFYAVAVLVHTAHFCKVQIVRNVNLGTIIVKKSEAAPVIEHKL